MSLNESTWRTAHAQDAGWTLFESFFIHLPFLFLCHNFHDKKKMTLQNLCRILNGLDYLLFVTFTFVLRKVTWIFLCSGY